MKIEFEPKEQYLHAIVDIDPGELFLDEDNNVCIRTETFYDCDGECVVGVALEDGSLIIDCSDGQDACDAPLIHGKVVVTS